MEQIAFQIIIESSIRFTVGSSSKVRLKVSGARKIIACTGITECQLVMVTRVGAMSGSERGARVDKWRLYQDTERAIDKSRSQS